MTFDWVTFGLQLVNALILLWILSRFLFRPVAAIIAARQEATAKALTGAETARAEAADAKANAEKEKEKTAAARVGVLEDARKDAAALHDRLLAEAREKAGEIVARAKEDAAHLGAEARAETLAKARGLALAMARRLMQTLPDEARVAGYPQRLAKALAALDKTERSALFGSEEGLAIVAPRALADTELAEVRAALGNAVPKSVPVEVDPDLIAGIELRGPQGALRNSLAADLEKIAEALGHDD